MFKRNITLYIGIIIGAIIFGTTGVLAGTIIAKDVTYDNSKSNINATNVNDAIDVLYTKANEGAPESYTGSYTYTPSTSIQTIYSANKRFNDNITINPIPSSYKNLTTNTTVNSSNLLNGITAYNNLGELVTGNLSTDCVSGSLVWTQNDVNNGRVIAQFKPSYLIVEVTNNIIYYNKYLDENKILRTKFNNTDIFSATGVDTISKYGLTEWRVQITNQVKLTYDDNRLNQTIYYTACK